MQLKFKMINLDCANCANKIERKLATLPFTRSVKVNFLLASMVIDVSEDISKEEIIKQVEQIVKATEPDCRVRLI